MMRRSSMVLVVLTAMFQGIPQAFGDYVLVQTSARMAADLGNFAPLTIRRWIRRVMFGSPITTMLASRSLLPGTICPNVWHCGQRQCEPPISQGRYGGFIGKRLGRRFATASLRSLPVRARLSERSAGVSG